jgi:transcriptional regulator with XRE-family HTH domain
MNRPSPLQRLGGRIRTHRTAAGLTPAHLARAAATDEETLAAIEAGRCDPDYLILLRIARALGVAIGALLSAMEEE